MKRIWAVGASVRALAESLTSAGYEVVAADLFNDYDLQQIAATQRIVDYPHDLLRLVEGVDADAWIYTGGLENHPELVDQLTARLPLLGNGGEALRCVRDVRLLQQALERAGIRIPEIAWEAPRDSDGWLRKSARSSGGLKVEWASVVTSPFKSHEYFQRYVSGKCYGATFLGTRLCAQQMGVCRQLSHGSQEWNSPNFLYGGSVGPVTLPSEVENQVLRAGQAVYEEFGLQGWFGIDFIVDETGTLQVLEVNPRYTASVELLEMAYHRSTADLHVAACRQQSVALPSLDLDDIPVVAKGVVYSAAHERIPPELVEMLKARWRRQRDVRDIPAEPQLFGSSSPMFTLYAQGNSEREALESLARKHAELRDSYRSVL